MDRELVTAVVRPGGIAPYIRHLRLPLQLTLAPLFLWGVFLAEVGSPETVGLAFVSLHLFLYPGVTAFNSAYDRDSGPVSFMASPPPAPPGLLGVSLLLQFAGALLAGATGPGLLALYLTIAALAAAYSHPAVRWKAYPWKSVAAVALGQGGLGLLAGWTTGVGGSATLAALGFTVATLTTAGLYPLTQVFQVDEDRARGDRTLSVALGPAGALRFGASCLIGAGAMMAVLAYLRLGSEAAVIGGTGYAAAALAVGRFAHDLDHHALPRNVVYRRAMRLNVGTTTVSLGVALLLLTLGR